MRTHEREVTQVTNVVIVVITACVVTRVSTRLVVAETKDSEVGQVDLAIGRKVNTHDNDDNALDFSATGRERNDDLALNGKVETARHNASATGDTTTEGGIAAAVCE
jgi:hypothetical protein